MIEAKKKEAKKLKHAWIVLYKDATYRCYGSPAKIEYKKLNGEWWHNTKCYAKVSPTKGIVVYKDAIWSVDFQTGKAKELKKYNWSGSTGCVDYNGHTVCIGNFKNVWRIDSNTGVFTKINECGESADLVGMVRLGDHALCLYRKSCW